MTDLESFGESFRKFMDSMVASTPVRKSVFAEHFRAALGRDPLELPTLSHEFSLYDHPNLQLALDELIASRTAQGAATEILGITCPDHHYQAPRFSALISPSSGFVIGPSEYDSFTLPDGRTIACLNLGIVILCGDSPAIIYVQGPSEYSNERRVTVTVVATTRQQAETMLADLRRRASALSVYRGQSIVVSSSYRGVSVRFHPLPKISREGIVLNEDTIARIERQTITFSEHRERLLAAGRHLKRGILLHGPPGTGKTLSAMYLASRMENRTVLLTTGLGLGSLAAVCSFARALQPATVILEDIDLIAQDREHTDECSMPLLFELLNQMDGLDVDADVLFVLTTNRPEALESALTARPGRIDQAIEVPLPDDECRLRLLRLYAKGLSTRGIDWSPWVGRTKGASASFVRELLRRAALLALLDGGDGTVEDRHLDESIRELTLNKSLTRKLLGFDSSGA